MIRTLTTFIGVTKNNNIERNFFYEKYILTVVKKKIYDYTFSTKISFISANKKKEGIETMKQKNA
jgi:hypothetical protein